MAGSKFARALEIVSLEVEKEFARKGGPSGWEELRTNKLFWRPFHNRLVNILNKELSLAVTKSTGRAMLGAACLQLSEGVRGRKAGGGRRHKKVEHVASVEELNAINSFISSSGKSKPAALRPFGSGLL